MEVSTSASCVMEQSKVFTETPLIENNLLVDRVHRPLSNTQNAIRAFRQLIRDAHHNFFDIVTSTVIQAASDLPFNLVAYYLAKHTLNQARGLQGIEVSKNGQCRS